MTLAARGYPRAFCVLLELGSKLGEFGVDKIFSRVIVAIAVAGYEFLPHGFPFRYGLDLVVHSIGVRAGEKKWVFLFLHLTAFSACDCKNLKLAPAIAGGASHEAADNLRGKAAGPRERNAKQGSSTGTGKELTNGASGDMLFRRGGGGSSGLLLVRLEFVHWCLIRIDCLLLRGCCSLLVLSLLLLL